MSDEPRQPGNDRPLDERVGAEERRKLRARRRRESPWFGFATFGLVGWSVAVPTLLGVALGVWLDHRSPGHVSWTLTLLGVGIAVGCLNAWHWVSREQQGMEEADREDSHDQTS